MSLNDLATCPDCGTTDYEHARKIKALQARLRAAEQELQELRTENKVLADALAQVEGNTP